MNIVEFHHVTLAYGYRIVLHDLTLSIAEGDTWLITGRNGSGKTTLLKAVAGLLVPTRGSIRTRLRPGEMGWLTHEASSYQPWRASELFEWYRRMFFRHQPPTPPADPILKRAWSMPIQSFSRGMRQRFFLHLLDVWAPRLICLDEPFTGLDEAARRWCRDRILEWQKRGCTLVITTHHDLDLDRAHTIHIENGRISMPSPVISGEPTTAQPRNPGA